MKLFYLAYATLLEGADVTPPTKMSEELKFDFQKATIFFKSADQTWQHCKIASAGRSTTRNYRTILPRPGPVWLSFHYHRLPRLGVF